MAFLIALTQNTIRLSKRMDLKQGVMSQNW